MNTGFNPNVPISTEEVFRAIRRRILKLELEPGQKLSENQMCEEYGVSRSVIRVVFTRLNQLGLLQVFPQRGTYVSLIDLELIRDLLLLRTAVEKEVLFEVFHDIYEEERKDLVLALDENLNQQEEFRNSEVYDLAFKKLDSAFHKMMIDSVKKYRLVTLLNDQMLHVTRWRNFDVTFDNRIPELINEHRTIFNAIKANDLLAAQSAMASHLETISHIDARAKAAYPQFFIK